MLAGPSVSGNPWPRLTAPVRAANSVISANIVEANGCSRGTSPWGLMAVILLRGGLSGHNRQRGADQERTGQAAGAAPDEGCRAGFPAGCGSGVRVDPAL